MAVDNRNFVNTFANEGGADVLVEDKRMDELKSATAKTGSQISTSAQYIPLQDTDGNLVKISPASFEEAVRNVLGSLLANNDKGTTISAVPALSGSGASLDFGSVSPANLASVLGVPRKQTLTPTQVAGTTYEITMIEGGFMAVLIYPRYSYYGMLILNSAGFVSVVASENYTNAYQISGDTSKIYIKAIGDSQYPIYYKVLW